MKLIKANKYRVYIKQIKHEASLLYMVWISEYFIQCDSFSVVKTPNDGRLGPKHEHGFSENIKFNWKILTHIYVCVILHIFMTVLFLILRPVSNLNEEEIFLSHLIS
jgi:hypothetical protein